MKTKWVVLLAITPFILALIALMTMGISVINEGYNYRPVAVREFSVAKWATTATWTVPNMAVGHAIAAYPKLDATVTTNSLVSSVYCTTAESVVVEFTRAVATAGTYVLIYNPGD